MGVLVTIHEWGHFFVAKLFNVKVLTFSIGFGKPLLRKQIGETEYRVATIPLGGYVKFLDERSEDETSPQEDLTRAFNRQKVYKRFAIVFAGPFVNLVFAWLVFSWLYFWGVPGVKPLFKDVVPGSSLAQVLSEDEGNVWQIVAINKQPTQTWQSVNQKLLSEKLAGNQGVQIRLVPFSEQGVNNPVDKVIRLPLSGLDLNKPSKNWLSQLGFIPFTPDFPAILGKVVPGSSAQSAGFEVGDQILAVGNFIVRNWSDFSQAIRLNPNKKVEITFKRRGQLKTVAVVLGAQKIKSQLIGVFGAAIKVDKQQADRYQTRVSFPFIEAMQKGLNHSVSLIVISFDMIRKIFQNEVSPTNLSGPVSIADYSGKALEAGWVSFFSLLGLLSLSLGFLNLLPVPMLDGGHLTLYVIEMFKGSPINEAMELFAQKVGLMIIVGLTVFALINDLVRISDD